MIILDTHIWIWWVHDHPDLTELQRRAIGEHEADGLGISAISCWEVAKLVEYKRLDLHRPTLEWLNHALSYPGVRLLDLSPQIAAESTALPGEFHKDPADQIIIATARVHDCPLLTVDRKILEYPHVKTL